MNAFSALYCIFKGQWKPLNMITVNQSVNVIKNMRPRSVYIGQLQLNLPWVTLKMQHCVGNEWINWECTYAPLQKCFPHFFQKKRRKSNHCTSKPYFFYYAMPGQVFSFFNWDKKMKKDQFILFSSNVDLEQHFKLWKNCLL